MRLHDALQRLGLMNPHYLDYAEYLQRLFPGVKVQKLSVNTGSGCPNRDGTLGTGGCIYCDNRSFTPSYCSAGMSVTQQVQAGKRFFARKYPEMKYLAYFQSYTNTYGDPQRLMDDFRSALAVPEVVGLVIGTRPDCMPDKLLQNLAALNTDGKRVMIEYGAESSHDRTLRLINRGHTWQQTCDTVRRTADAGLPCGLHLIAGLPGESDEDVLQTVRRAVQLPIDSLKMHQLQVIRGTALSHMVERSQLLLRQYTVEQYLDLCVQIVQTVRRADHPVAIERFLSQAPPEMVLSPKWGLKNYQFAEMLKARLAKL